MAIARWRLTGFLTILCLLLPAAAWAAEKSRLRVDDYRIDAELFPKDHRLVARAQVKFTALDDISIAVFELHNALRPSLVLDAEGRQLSAERVSQDSTIRVALPAGLAKGASTTLIIEY
ncbi:MAG: peptidase M1, partial [Terriglobales bacterium]